MTVRQETRPEAAKNAKAARASKAARAASAAPGAPIGARAENAHYSAHHAQTSTRGLTNTRTRIVGDRTGVAADAVIGIVRVAQIFRSAFAQVASRVGDVVTPLGWCMAIVVPFSIVVGYRFGLVELVSVGFAGIVLLVVGAVYLIGRSAVAIDISIPHGHVVVGQPAHGEVIVRNPSRHRVLGSRVEIPVGTGLAEIAMPGLAHGAEFRHEFPVPTSQRGVIPIGPVRTVRADPVGMVRRELAWTDEKQLFVHPRTIALPSTSTGLIRDLEGQPTRDLSNSDVSFHALREYTPGDERRYIHWKSTAKTGTYMVRQFEETRRSRLVVALSLATSDYASDDEFEMAVSTAGSLGIRAIRDARDVSVVVGEITPEFAKRKVLGIRQLASLSRTRLLDDLAGVALAESSLQLVDVARVTSDRVAGISVAYLVCGSLTSATELRAASVQFPLGVEVIAVVCDPEAVPGLRRVSGLSVLTIGYLEDLKRSLARAAAV